MKKLVRIAVPFVLVICFTTMNHCSKKKDSADSCRVCKVLGGGVDQQTIQKQVCSDDEEKAFRDANAGKTVTCN